MPRPIACVSCGCSAEEPHRDLRPNEPPCLLSPELRCTRCLRDWCDLKLSTLLEGFKTIGVSANGSVAIEWPSGDVRLLLRVDGPALAAAS